MKDDEFIREVNEEYRRDRAAQVWTRYSGVFIGLAVLVVLGVGGWRYWQHAQTVQAEAASQRGGSARYQPISSNPRAITAPAPWIAKARPGSAPKRKADA